MMKSRIAVWGVIALLAVGLATLMAVFSASNTVPDSKAGEGQGVVSGYTVTNVHYALNATNASNIDSVTFTVDTAPPAGAVVKVKLVSTGSSWYSCTNVTTSVTCATTSPQATVSATDELRVIAAQ
jgi:hypothetical protein